MKEDKTLERSRLIDIHDERGAGRVENYVLGNPQGILHTLTLPIDTLIFLQSVLPSTESGTSNMANKLEMYSVSCSKSLRILFESNLCVAWGIFTDFFDNYAKVKTNLKIPVDSVLASVHTCVFSTHFFGCHVDSFVDYQKCYQVFH